MGNRSWIYFSVILLPNPWLTFFALVFITYPEGILPADGLGLRDIEARSTPDLVSPYDNGYIKQDYFGNTDQNEFHRGDMQCPDSQKYDRLTRVVKGLKSEIKQLRAALEEDSFETPGTYSNKGYDSNEDPYINSNIGHIPLIPTNNPKPPRGQNPIPGQDFPLPSNDETTEEDYSSDINPVPGQGTYKHGTVRPSNPRPTRKPTRHKNARRTTPQSLSDEEDYELDQSNIPGNPGVRPSNKPPTTKPDSSKPKGRIILEETFSDRSWSSKWIYTKFVGNDSLKFEKFYRVRTKDRAGSKASDYGLMTSNKGAEDYAISTTFPSLSSYEGTLVVQFSLQYQTIPHCEYVFLRLFDCRFKPEDFNPESPFLIQLGPDICGTTDTNQVSVIMLDPFKSEKRVINQKICAVTSTKIHTYTLVIEPDGNFKILTNDNPVQNGTLRDVFQNYQGYSSICAAGISVWHSVLDKFFRGQIIIDDILVTTDVDYAEKRRTQILDRVETNSNNNGSKGSSSYG